jgi:ubiquinone/menaquinone biosynthesis C-methylase UbiE
MFIADRLHAAVHRRHDTGFDQRHSAAYDRLSRWTLRGLYRRVAVDVAAAAPPAATVLDVGTGPGRLLHDLADRRPDLELTGIDPSADMIHVAGRAAASRGLRDHIRFRVADVAALPYPNQSINIIVSTLSMHHWPDPATAAAELARVLRPGGRVLIYDFRFAPIGTAINALNTQATFATAGVRQAPIRAGWHPVALFTRLTAAAPDVT